jgi:hypothetical protein
MRDCCGRRSQRSATVSAREFSYSDRNGVHRAIEPDMAAELDTPAEMLAETHRIPLEVAEAILADFKTNIIREVIEEEVTRLVAAYVTKIFAYLLQPQKNLKAVLWGFAFSQGIATRLNGIRNPSALARQLGCTRALISFYKRRADAEFGSSIKIFGKSNGACESYRKARLSNVKESYAAKYETNGEG